MKKAAIHKFLFFLCVAFVFIISFLVIKNHPLMVDENQDYPSIVDIAHWNITPELFYRTSVLPGYHFIMGGLAFIFHTTNVSDIRFLHLLITSLNIVVFYKLLKKLGEKHTFIKTLQFLLFPVNFIFYFVLYSDVFSLLFVLLTFYLLLEKKYFFSGLIGLVSLFIRQDNIFWLLFFYTYEFLNNITFTHGNVVHVLKKQLFPFIKKMWMYEIAMVAMAGFMLYFHGATISIDNQRDHPISLHTDNAFFFLFILAITFFPMILYKIPKISQFLGKKTYFITALIWLFAIYWLTFSASHYFNSPFPPFDFTLRNKILQFARSSTDFNKYLFFIPILFGFLLLLVTKLTDKKSYLIYLFSLLLFSTQWLVEPRYYIVAFSLFLLFRKYTNDMTEYAITFVFAAITIFILLGTASGAFFL